MSDSDNDSMNGSMDDSMDESMNFEGGSNTAIVLAGMELTPGAEPQPLAPAGELPESAVCTLTRATLVMKKPLPNNTMLYVRSHVNEEQIIVLTVLSNSHPTSALDICFHADSVPEFSIEAVGGAATDATVHISGYVEVTDDGNNDEDEDDYDSEEGDQEIEDMIQELREKKDDQQNSKSKKRKAVDEEIDSDEADEEKPAPQPKPAKAQKQTPQPSASQKQAAAAAPQSIKLPSGVVITDEVVGNGSEAQFGKQIQIRYRGELMNGKVFDTNMPKGKPFAFKLGVGECIPGFDAGIKGMKVGGRRVMTIPAHLGYGKRGSPPQIPPNANLKFTVELIKC